MDQFQQFSVGISSGISNGVQSSNIACTHEGLQQLFHGQFEVVPLKNIHMELFGIIVDYMCGGLAAINVKSNAEILQIFFVNFIKKFQVEFSV